MQALLKTFLLGIFILWLSPNTFAQANLQQVKTDVVYLADDMLKGRLTGTDGEKMAAEYIAWRMENMGLTAAGTEGFYQRYEFSVAANPHDEKSKGSDYIGTNVAGFLNHGAEYTIVIGAHYDHLGVGGHGSLHVGEDEIHNGADDNASGVAGMLRLADILKGDAYKANNYMFVAFSGEELGLYGSKYYAANSTVDIGKINYMFNMDMIGRLNAEKVLSVNGVGTSPIWPDLVKAKNKVGLQVTTTESGIGPSDHTSFYLKDLPVLHFFSGQHTDYHKPSDDAALVNFEGIVSITDYMAELIAGASTGEKITFSKSKDENNRQAAAFKVTLGVMPDYVYNGKGMRIDAVMDERPAAKAGMKAGDIVTKIGDVKVNNIYDYMEGLASFKKGETAPVEYEREGKTKKAKVTF